MSATETFAPAHNMTSWVKAAGLAGILVAVIATVTPDVKAAQVDDAVREGQAVVTELSANASAITYWVSESDGWHVVTTVDTVIAHDGNAEKHAVVRFSSVLLSGQSQLISVPLAIGERTAGPAYPSPRRPDRGRVDLRLGMTAMPAVMLNNGRAICGRAFSRSTGYG
jgi:hypothetical protein